MFAKTNAMKVLLVTTDHFLVRLWFKDDEDFRVAMNYAAIASLITSVNILAFILMSNHVHFVLYCTAGDAKLFIDTFKKLYGAYYCRKYNVHDYLRRVGVDIREASGDTAAERVIAYVQMNCVAANGPAVWVFAADWVTLFRYEETNSFRSGRDAAQYH